MNYAHVIFNENNRFRFNLQSIHYYAKLTECEFSSRHSDVSISHFVDFIFRTTERKNRYMKENDRTLIETSIFKSSTFKSTLKSTKSLVN